MRDRDEGRSTLLFVVLHYQSHNLAAELCQACVRDELFRPCVPHVGRTEYKPRACIMSVTARAVVPVELGCGRRVSLKLEFDRPRQPPQRGVRGVGLVNSAFFGLVWKKSKTLEETFGLKLRRKLLVVSKGADGVR